MKTVNQTVTLKRSWKVRQTCEESKWLLINSALRSWDKISPLCSAFGKGRCFCIEHSEKTKISILQKKTRGQRAIGAQNKRLSQLPSKLLVDWLSQEEYWTLRKYSEISLSAESEMCDQPGRSSVAWDWMSRHLTTCLLREKSHQADWLARKTELHCVIYCWLNSPALAGFGIKHCIAFFTLVGLFGVLVSVILSWNLLVLVISPWTWWGHCYLLGICVANSKSWRS